MSAITRCPVCGTTYEEWSERAAAHPGRRCQACYGQPAPVTPMSPSVDAEVQNASAYSGGAILLVLLLSGLAIGGVCLTLCLIQTLGGGVRL